MAGKVTHKKVVFELPVDIAKKLKYLAFLLDTTQVKIVEDVLKKHIAKWEKDKGTIKIK